MQVTIVITCYNYARFLSRAIRSAVDQSLDKSQLEVIVVNDASTDETEEIMASYSGFIRPIHLENNSGLAVARNTGIKMALGRYVINLDADDYLDKEASKMLSIFLNYNPTWNAVACDYIEVDNNEQHVTRKNWKEDPIACGVLFRKDRLFDIGLYDSQFRMAEDEDLQKRFEKLYEIHHIELPLYRYRKHGCNMTNDVETHNKYKEMVKEKLNEQK